MISRQHHDRFLTAFRIVWVSRPNSKQGFGSMQRTRILLVEDNCLIRAGLVAILHALSNMDIVGTSGSEDALVCQLTECKPHVVIVNPGRHDDNGFHLIGSLKKQSPTTKIVAIDLI